MTAQPSLIELEFAHKEDNINHQQDILFKIFVPNHLQMCISWLPITATWSTLQSFFLRLDYSPHKLFTKKVNLHQSTTGSQSLQPSDFFLRLDYSITPIYHSQFLIN